MSNLSKFLTYLKGEMVAHTGTGVSIMVNFKYLDKKMWVKQVNYECLNFLPTVAFKYYIVL